MNKCKICDEPIAKETMSKENLEFFIEILDVEASISALCMNCIIVMKHMNDCNAKALTFFSKAIDKLQEKTDDS